MICYCTFATIAEARKYVEERDLGGVFIVEGLGSANQPWVVADAGTAEDILADDAGRTVARVILVEADRRGSYTVRMSSYRRSE